jgi:hypothetical protein
MMALTYPNLYAPDAKPNVSPKSLENVMSQLTRKGKREVKKQVTKKVQRVKAGGGVLVPSPELVKSLESSQPPSSNIKNFA